MVLLGQLVIIALVKSNGKRIYNISIFHIEIAKYNLRKISFLSQSLALLDSLEPRRLWSELRKQRQRTKIKADSSFFI